MRKLIVWNLMTLDGYFEGRKPWELDFHMLAWGDELEAYSLGLGAEGDLLVFGRKTYEGMAAYWPTAPETPAIAAYMNGVEKLVASHTMTAAAWNNSSVTADPVAELTALKRQAGKTIFVFGSADLVDTLAKAGLVDEYRICLVPVVLGAGTAHFKPADAPRPMRLLDSRPLENGALILRYEPAAAE